VHSDLPAASGLAFPAAPQLQALQTMVVRTHLSNYVSVPTDCPQREKRGWSGDGQLTTHSGLLNFDGLAFYEQWWASALDQQRIGCLPPGEPSRSSPAGPLRPFNWACSSPMFKNLTLEQYQYGPIGDVLPFEQLGMGNFAGDPSWEVLAVVVPYELLTLAGDVAAVAAGYDGPKSLLTFFGALGSADPTSSGLIATSYLGDWKALDTPNNLLVANINYLMAALLTAEMAFASGADADAVADLALASALSAALQARFFDATAMRWDRGSQSAQILALAFGAGNASVQQPAADALVAALAAADGHLTFGASGARFALDVLHGAARRPDLALALASEPAYPSWQYMIENSSLPGTMFEDWSGPAQPDGSSDNHIFKAGGITGFLLEQALGLDAAMRVAGAASGGDDGCECEAALDMAFSLRGRFGFSCAHVAALCEVVAGGGGGGGGGGGATLRPLGELSAAAAAALARRGLAAAHAGGARALEPRLALTVTAAAARAVGAAAGWRVTPAGNASFAWSFAAGRLRASAFVPFASDARMELPLELFRAGARVRVSLGGGEVCFVGGNGALIGASEAMLVEWRPAVLPCGAGAAARHVSGRALRGGAACGGGVGGGRVLVMHAPGGASEVELAEEA